MLITVTTTTPKTKLPTSKANVTSLLLFSNLKYLQFQQPIFYRMTLTNSFFFVVFRNLMVVEMAFQNKALKTYNLNVNVAAHMTPGALLGIEGPCLTPRTPEIVNSLIAMGNPFDSLGKTGQENTSPNSEDSRSDAASPTGQYCLVKSFINRVYP